MGTISTNNYTLGQAELYFEASVNNASLDDGTSNGVGSAFRTAARRFGNITDIELQPNVSYLDHFVVTQTGVKQKDLTVANELSLSISFSCDEINATNFRKFMFGTAVTDASLLEPATSGPAFTIMSNTLNYGSAQIYFRTGVGRDFVYMIPKCTIRPDGNLPLSSEDWLQMPYVLEVFNNHWNAVHIATSGASVVSNYGLISMTAIG